MKLLCTVRGVPIYQEDDLRIHYPADLSVDVDGAREAYRLDNSREKGALDDIVRSAGYPNGSWWNVLARDPSDRDKPFVDANGFCVSMTSYQRAKDRAGNPIPMTDRRRYVDAVKVPYSVPPGRVRALCKGVLLGCLAKITDTLTGKSIECITADFSGNSIGEASVAAAHFFDPRLSARNGDERSIYLYEFWPGTSAVINGETFELQPA